MELEPGGWEQQQQLEERRRFEEEFQPHPRFIAEMKRLKDFNETWKQWSEQWPSR